MDIPNDVGASGRSSLQTNWIFEVWPVAYADLVAGVAAWPNGFPGVQVDSRTAAQPKYSNNISLGGLLDRSFTGCGPDNTALAEPNSPGLFIANKSGSALANFIRLFLADITDANVGLSIQKIVTSEDCANPNAYRWFLCSPLLLPG